MSETTTYSGGICIVFPDEFFSDVCCLCATHLSQWCKCLLDTLSIYNRSQLVSHSIYRYIYIYIYIYRHVVEIVEACS